MLSMAAAPPFVIPSGAERSAVQRTYPGKSKGKMRALFRRHFGRVATDKPTGAEAQCSLDFYRLRGSSGGMGSFAVRPALYRLLAAHRLAIAAVSSAGPPGGRA